MLIRWGTSLGLHLTAFLLLVVFSGRTPSQTKITIPIQLEVAHPTRTQNVGRKSGAIGRSAPHEASIPLSRLGVSMQTSIQAANIRGSIKGWIEDENARGKGQNLGSALGTSDRNTSAYQYLYRRIDQFTPYPMELKTAGIEGTVSADLYFTTQGEFKRELSEFRASSNYLKVAVIRGLKQALVDPLPSSLQKFERPFHIHCEFTFERSETNDPSLATQHRLVSVDRFSFYRYDPHSRLQWQAGPFSGFGPVGLSLNPLWFVSKISNAFSKKVKIDPLDRYRDDPEW